MGGVTPEGKVYSLVRPHSLNGLHSIAFLAHLVRQVAGRILVIWDGSPIHRRAEVKAFLADQAARSTAWRHAAVARTSTRWNGCRST